MADMSGPMTTDAWRLAAIGVPPMPMRGMKIWVQTGSHWSIGQSYSISRVNSRSFYVATDGKKKRLAILDWHAWLREREREGRVALDGHPMRSVRVAPLSDAFTASGFEDELADDGEEREGAMKRRVERDARIMRAVRQVVRDYTLSELDSEADDDPLFDAEDSARRSFRLTRRGAAYTVRIDPTWRRRPDCDCPDARKRLAQSDGAVFCKHIVATLIQREELRHQLLDLFL